MSGAPPGNRIRPLFVLPFGSIGGSELVLTRLLDSLDERYEPSAVVLTDGNFVQELRTRDVPTIVRDLPGKQGFAGFPVAVHTIARELRGQRVSFIHANGIKGAIFGVLLARRLRVPVLWMKHDHVYDGWPTLAVASLCDRVVCVSEAMAAQFPPRLRRRVSIAYPGVALPAPSSPADTELLVVSVGRLDPLKGFETLIDALGLLRQRGLDAKLRVAGPVDRIHPGHGETLRAIVEQRGLSDHVEVGWADDLDGLYESARVVAQASRPRKPGLPSEGAPTTLMEAMSHSRPVVAPDEPGIAEVAGDGGTLVRERTPEGFADALEPFLRDPRLAEEVGLRGRRRASERFSMERTVETLAGLYRELAREAGG